MSQYRVTVQGRVYRVEVGDLDVQPVRAVVNGRAVEVWVEDEEQSVPEVAEAPPGPVAKSAVGPTVLSAGPGAPSSAMSAQVVVAPMPGGILEVAVKPGDTVSVGQDLCVLEAMKMNNRIRATRAARIAEVHVSAGDQVQYGDRLITYADDAG